MNISITLPDSIATLLSEQWTDIPRRALEALAVNAYRDGAITGPQLQQILGLRTRFELDGFLKQAGVYLDYTEADLDADIRALDAARPV